VEGVGVSFWRGRRVLVTGHTGFKGSWLTIWLRELGADVTGYALASETSPNHYELANAGEGVRSILADVRDARAMSDAFAAAKPEVVFHLAAQSLVRPSYEQPRETYDVNVIGTVNVLDAVRASESVRAAVVVTSDKCYENREWLWGYRENEPLGGHDPYSSSKACAELVTAAYRSSFFRDTKTRIATARAGNVIGGGDWARDRLIPDLMTGFAAGTKPLIRNPRATRPWQFVLEPLHGYMQLAERLCADDGDTFADAWNFGPEDRDVRPVGAIADQISELWGEGAGYALDARVQPHEAHALKLDSSKARAKLGWSSKLDLDQALAWTVRWYRTWAETPDRLAARTREDLAAYSATQQPSNPATR
jgi:CDP-glucose 4,6-dehydratase